VLIIVLIVKMSSSIITALDNHTPKQIGENGSTEYTWSNSVREQIVQFSFQLVRTKGEPQVIALESVLKTILETLKARQDKTHDSESLGLLSILYRMIGSTRDIIDGKGEYLLTYMMIYTWYEFYPELSRFALLSLFYTDEKITHQYGSWKDIKKFCGYCLTKDSNNASHPLVVTAIELANDKLYSDNILLNSAGAGAGSDKTNVSLVARWIPREKSKYGWLFKLLATHYYSDYLFTAKTPVQIEKAQKKCYMEYRKLISELNVKLDTLQIKQCSNNWSNIDFKKVTSISFTKQKQAFLNLKKGTKSAEARYPDRQDRVECSENFTKFVEKSIKEGKEIKGARVGMESFTKQAKDLLNQTQDSTVKLQIDLLNSQWRDNSKQTGKLAKMLAMVDVSGSMEGDPMNVAIALGIRIADKSILGKRVMTFSSNPTWVNLENHDDFVSQVKAISRAEWGMNTNIYKAMKMILGAIEENKLTPEEVQDMVLAILSDMQIDQAYEHGVNKDTLYENIETMYIEAGMRVHGKPYKPPHIIFWNLRSTSGFPTLSTQPNVSMLSGFSASFLNLFCEQGMEALESITPWAQLERTLENERYNILKEFIAGYFW
jgi:hypothetical protein